MMTLQQALPWVAAGKIVGNPRVEIKRVHTDTRSLQPGDLFVALKGDNFWAHWENETVNTLFVKVRDNMPPNFTGNQLEPQVKLDIVTYVLHSNDLPTGKGELKTQPEVLDELQILKKGTSMTLPNFALVQALG